MFAYTCVGFIVFDIKKGLDFTLKSSLVNQEIWNSLSGSLFNGSLSPKEILEGSGLPRQSQSVKTLLYVGSNCYSEIYKYC